MPARRSIAQERLLGVSEQEGVGEYASTVAPFCGLSTSSAAVCINKTPIRLVTVGRTSTSPPPSRHS